jgi:hypothetical protein
MAGDVLADLGTPEIREHLGQFIASGSNNDRQRMFRLRRAAVTLMQSPEYQLC